MTVAICRILSPILGGIIGVEIGLLLVVTLMPDHQASRDLRRAAQEWVQAE